MEGYFLADSIGSWILHGRRGNAGVQTVKHLQEQSSGVYSKEEDNVHVALIRSLILCSVPVDGLVEPTGKSGRTQLLYS